VYLRNNVLCERQKWRGSYQRKRCEDDFMMMCAGWERDDLSQFRAIVPFAGVKGWGQPQK
jgi:hypothetical protein